MALHRRTTDEESVNNLDTDYQLHLLCPEPEDCLIDIVAIHGLSGHWANTYIDGQSRTFWLRDLLPLQIPRARIMSYGWPSALHSFGGSSSKHISSRAIAEDLLFRLDCRRENTPALHMAYSKEEYQNTFNAIRGLVFFGTPHRGAVDRLVSIGSIGQRILDVVSKPVVFDHGDPLNILSKKAPAHLETLHDQFLDALRSKRNISIVSFFEEQPTHFGGTSFGIEYKMVDKFSAQIGFLENERVIGLNAEHRNLCRFKGPNNSDYVRVWRAIKAVAETAYVSRYLQDRPGVDSIFDSDAQTPDDSLDTTKGYLADLWFEKFRQEVQPATEERHNGDEDYVARVAIIDTGLDYLHPLIQEHRTQIKAWRSFIPGQSRGEHDVSRGDQDAHGHGTHVAHILLQIAPRADVYVARAFYDGSNGEWERNKLGIAEAIMHAAAVWKVDIISMSCGARREVPEIKAAIREAFAKGVTIFAAASNFGATLDDPIAFPANLRQVICINSTDRYGGPSRFNPPARPDTSFAILGEAVKAAWPGDPDRPTRRKTGSSVATPIAAGVAALIMKYSRQRGANRTHRVENPERLRHCDEMRKVFRCMVTNFQSSYRCLVPGNIFNKRSGLDTISHPAICAKIHEALDSQPYSN